MFKNGFKYGFGMAIGYILGAAIIKVTAKNILKATSGKNEQ